MLHPKDLQTSNKLLIDSKKCNQKQNSLSTSIRLNFVQLQMQNIWLNCNIAIASQYNDCLGTRSKTSSFLEEGGGRMGWAEGERGRGVGREKCWVH